MKQEEFENIVPELREVMFSVGRNFFGNENDANDVAQEGLLDLCKYIAQMDVSQKHHALAIRVAKHCCVDIVRKRKKIVPLLRGDVSDYAPPWSNRSSSPEEILEVKELRLAMHEAVDRLKPSERQLFELRQIEGMSLDEIVRQTNIPKSSVKSMISAARKKIFKELKEKMK